MKTVTKKEENLKNFDNDIIHFTDSEHEDIQYYYFNYDNEYEVYDYFDYQELPDAFNVNYNPFANCQVFSIGNFHCLISYFPEMINEIINYLKYKMSASKPILFVDISEEDFNEIEEHVNVLSYCGYTSSNGHKMYGVYIDTRTS